MSDRTIGGRSSFFFPSPWIELLFIYMTFTRTVLSSEELGS